MRSAHPAPRGERLLRPAAVAIAVLCAAATAATVWLDALLAGAGTPPDPLNWAHWGSAGSGFPVAVAGGVLATRLPRHPLTWLMLAGGSIAVLDGVAAAYASLSVLEHDGDLPLTAFAVYAGGRFGPMINMIVPLTLMFFPDGRLPSRRWRWPVAAAITAQFVGVMALLMVPWDVFSQGEPLAPGLRDVPLDPLTPPLPAGLWPVSGWMFYAGFLTSFGVSIAAFTVRFRRSDPVRRAQLRWMLLALIVNVVAFASGMVLTEVLSPSLNWWIGDISLILMHAAIAVAVLVAVARYRLYDVDLLLGWTLLYAGLAAVVIGIDVAVFVLAGTFIDEPLAAVTGAGVVAVLYAPLRLRLQRWVNRVLTGRAEPYDVVSALARRLERSMGPDELLLEVARVVAESFRSPYVRVELDRADGRTVVVEHGTARDDVVVLPFGYRGAAIGRLALVPRTGSRLPASDQRLLADVVRQAAAAARATALTEELQRSREQLVTGIAEERRRLRRDLHDGLGPSLAAAALKIEAARNLAPKDGAAADATLESVREDLSVVLSDVRRLVHDLRPPSLDQFGLAGAVEQLMERFQGRSLRVRLHCAGELAALPAAAEEAAYRIVAEALANVSRHAEATRCDVRLEACEDALEVEVADDGRGVPPGALVGVGLVGMRERAEELGGRCAVSARPGGGTLVRAVLPFGPRDVAESEPLPLTGSAP
ncbi:histidine kinase/DNA gyrase B/HSP90-like ATPase [Actinomadura pelletieri DSM 43383]|uniref:Histidine kinase/DNA gyrase B/HSP90-like ATPase n=1 Tax=Actinomadura pelletieri DSM 43383 TaxID=1120940 RepID=A0A495QTE8_9ACTN|nr:sensor histidine kinase [Actinomadura pelletieri]RKS76723.1 histidine kinase/DNA gyrase B/HSP90-like ATPase [Actinomadura pelletieri DSM 43383]